MGDVTHVLCTETSKQATSSSTKISTPKSQTLDWLASSPRMTPMSAHVLLELRKDRFFVSNVAITKGKKEKSRVELL